MLYLGFIDVNRTVTENIPNKIDIFIKIKRMHVLYLRDGLISCLNAKCSGNESGLLPVFLSILGDWTDGADRSWGEAAET